MILVIVARNIVRKALVDTSLVDPVLVHLLDEGAPLSALIQSDRIFDFQKSVVDDSAKRGYSVGFFRKAFFDTYIKEHTLRDLIKWLAENLEEKHTVYAGVLEDPGGDGSVGEDEEFADEDGEGEDDEYEYDEAVEGVYIGSSADEYAPPPRAEPLPGDPAGAAPSADYSAGSPDRHPNASILNVFYATDRLKIQNGLSGPQYGAGRAVGGSLEFGQCTISIPKKHKLGKLESPSIWKLEFVPDPAKHILLHHTLSMDDAVFFEEVSASVARSEKKEAFVFIHGYNVSFEDAARRTGQIAFDLHFQGAPVFYSWPSNDKTADYTMDEANIIWSTPHFQKFLLLFSQHSGAERIHIIAHSMGNRAVCDALKILSYVPSIKLKINQLVLAAPDIDAQTFEELAEMLKTLSGRVTIYESSKDKALFASKRIHGNPRAGEPVMVIPGMDTIDASNINTDFLGHSYYSDTWALLSDIYTMIADDKLPGARFGLELIESKTYGNYYAFKSS